MNIDVKFPELNTINTDRHARIVSVGLGLPENKVTNQDIIDKFKVIATDRAVQYTLGIKERRWMVKDEKLEDLMKKAVGEALEKAGIEIDAVDRIIYTRLFGDYNIPASSISVLKTLGAKEGTPAFDITSACSGFLHAMDLAMRYVSTGDDYVVVIGGSAMGKCVYWGGIDHKIIFNFGDAIVAMVLENSEKKHIHASYIFTNHNLYYNAHIPWGTGYKKNKNDKLDISKYQMNILDTNIIFKSSVDYSRIIADKLLKEAKLSIEDIDYFITSDQTTRIWEAQLEELGIPKNKSISVFYRHGNTVAAMSPLNLNELIQTGLLKRGNIVMMMAHGAGASSGGMIFEY